MIIEYSKTNLYNSILEIIKTSLDNDAVTTDDDFFDAGGDSMSMLLFAIEIEKAFSIKLAFSAIINSREIGKIIENVISQINEKS